MKTFGLLAIILASSEPCMAQSLVYFTPLPSLDILKVIYLARHLACCHPPIVEPPGTAIPVPTLVKKLSKMAGIFILGYLNRRWF